MIQAKTPLFVGLCSVALATFGCREQPRSASDAEGTLQFVVRAGEEAGSAVPRGSFEVRGIDNAERARVGIGGSTARTVHLRLPAGAYSVSFRPAPPPSSPAGVHPAAARQQQIVVVSPERSTTVDVLAAARRSAVALTSLHDRPR